MAAGLRFANLNSLTLNPDFEFSSKDKISSFSKHGPHDWGFACSEKALASEGFGENSQNNIDLNATLNEEEEEEEESHMHAVLIRSGKDSNNSNGQSKLCAGGHWRPAEDTKLKELVALYDPQNWNLIAEKLEGRSVSPLILSMVCSIVLHMYQHLRSELMKLQLEAFFSCVILRLAQSRFGGSYQQQEVAMEALVDFCRQKTFMVEMYANLDCEDLADLLSRSSFPVNCPLSSMHILVLDGVIAVIHGMAERVGNA